MSEDQGLVPAQRRRWGRFWAAIILLPLVIYFVFVQPRKAPSTVAFTTLPILGALDPDCPPTVSRDGAHVGYVTTLDDKQVVVFDGKADAQTYRAIRKDWTHSGDVELPGGIVLSPRGGRYAYVAFPEEKKQVAVIDGKASRAYDDIEIPRFSTDGAHVGYIARDGQFSDCVSDGKVIYRTPVVRPRTLTIGGSHLRWSPDFQHIAVTEVDEKQRKMHVVWRGKRGPAYDRVDWLEISPDSQRLAYIAMRGKRYFQVVDGVESPAYDRVFAVSFSPDSRRTSYCIVQEGKHRPIIDGKAGPRYANAFAAHFSPDNRHLAYTASDDRREWFMVRDGKPGKKFPRSFWEIRFSPDSSRLLYEMMPDWEGEGKAGIITDDSTFHPRTTNGFFSPDSRHVAAIQYVDAQEPGEDPQRLFRVVRDWTPDTAKASEDIPEPLFSPDSRHLAYPIVRNGKWSLVIDGKAQPIEGELLHTCRPERHDPIPASGMIQFSDLFFDAPDRLHYFVLRGKEIKRVDVVIPRG